MTSHPPGMTLETMAAPMDIRVSNRDPATVQHHLESWLAEKLGEQAAPRISGLRSPGGAGHSSDTLLFDLEWQECGEARTSGYVARLPPPPDSLPLFPSYDLALQVRTMDLVRQNSRVPVPAVQWYEPTGSVLGVPFFVMELIAGKPATDNPPYVFGGWLPEAGPLELRSVEDGYLRVIADIHAIPAPAEEVDFLIPKHPGETPLQRHFSGLKAHYEWGRNGKRFPLVEQLFDWLENRWPIESGENVICWGDARIANILWQDFRPAAVLDWEMATLAPPQLDLAWQIFFHKYFQNVALFLGMPEAPMPDFMRRHDLVARYEQLTGKKLHHMDWFLAYSLLRIALVDIRTTQRRIRFGEIPEPQDPNAYLICRALVEKVLQGGDPWI